MGIHYWTDTILIFAIFALLLLDVYLTVLRLHKIDKLLKENSDTDKLLKVLKENADIGIEIADESETEQPNSEDGVAAH